MGRKCLENKSFMKMIYLYYYIHVSVLLSKSNEDTSIENEGVKHLFQNENTHSCIITMFSKVFEQ
jgi:hypothetical protein